jgi:hypothetical protein
MRAGRPRLERANHIEVTLRLEQPASRSRLGFSVRSVEPRGERLHGRRGAAPQQLVHIVEERDVGTERSEHSEQQSLIALA